MASKREKTGLSRIHILLRSQQIALSEMYDITYGEEVVDKVTLDRYLNKGDDISGEESVVQLIANTYWDSL